MLIHEHEAYYQAGLGVAAMKLGVDVRQLAVGFENRTHCGPTLEPFETWYRSLVDDDSVDQFLVEDYITVCLSGSAGQYLGTEARRCPLKRSQGSAGLELKYLRKVWQGAEPETEQAFAIAFSLLGELEDGDPEAVLYRLWHRAVRLLRKLPQRDQLDRLARQLRDVGQIAGDAIAQFLKE